MDEPGGSNWNTYVSMLVRALCADYTQAILQQTTDKPRARDWTCANEHHEMWQSAQQWFGVADDDDEVQEPMNRNWFAELLNDKKHNKEKAHT